MICWTYYFWKADFECILYRHFCKNKTQQYDKGKTNFSWFDFFFLIYGVPLALIFDDSVTTEFIFEVLWLKWELKKKTKKKQIFACQWGKFVGFFSNIFVNNFLSWLGSSYWGVSFDKNPAFISRRFIFRSLLLLMVFL